MRQLRCTSSTTGHQSICALVQGAGWPSCGGHTSGPRRGQWGQRARARAALGEIAAGFGAQRGGFVAAAWGARGDFLRATAFGMRGAERAPHLGTLPQKTATLRASAVVCLRYAGR